jgi:hypothetical protein
VYTHKHKPQDLFCRWHLHWILVLFKMCSGIVTNLFVKRVLGSPYFLFPEKSFPPQQSSMHVHLHTGALWSWNGSRGWSRILQNYFYRTKNFNNSRARVLHKKQKSLMAQLGIRFLDLGEASYSPACRNLRSHYSTAMS